MMNRLIAALLIALLFVTGCTSSQGTEPPKHEQGAENKDFRIYEGRIAEKTIRWENTLLILLIPNLSKEEAVTKKPNELIEQYGKQDIAYYVVDKKLYDKLEIGQKVKIKAELDQLEPYPPIRSIIELEVIE
ncbi:DUF3221 domain-containing protein [Paenibacillus agilis]|nr:DUF3221 domain-containing protein [Paenibacillus agilis]